MFALTCIALANAAALRDAGEVVDGSPVLVVVTPGIAASAYGRWIAAIESRGMDAWVFEADPASRSDEVAAALAGAARSLAADRGTVRVAAHGWGGVYALMAGVDAERLALVGVPLGPQAVAGPLSGQRWPWETGLIGVMPPAKAPSGTLDAYRAWVSEFPLYDPPSAPTLLVASNMDVVAPPEVVRLPSAGWPQRTWERTGFLSLDSVDLSHADLLSDPGLARRVAKFLEEGE